ncbi:MAG: hypothetical protein U5K71_01540 [Gracilimonas sp.]|nr:hypothetical protein [Gracilimonas sp.]
MKTIGLLFTLLLLGVSSSQAQYNYTDFSDREFGFGVHIGPVFDPYSISGNSFFWGAVSKTENWKKNFRLASITMDGGGLPHPPAVNRLKIFRSVLLPEF